MRTSAGLLRNSLSPRGLLRAVVAFAPLLAGGCEGRRELREWQPSDHQPPPAVAPEGQGEAAEEGDSTVRAAAALWGMRCASCHGAGGRGDGSGRPPGAALPDLTSASFQSSRTDVELHTAIKAGRGLMPAFGDQLSDLGIEALVKHVRTLGRRE